MNNIRKYTNGKNDNYDMFLSHNVFTKGLVLTLVNLFNKTRYSVYVDWIEDKQLDRSNDGPETATILRKRMKASMGLVFLSTS